MRSVCEPAAMAVSRTGWSVILKAVSSSARKIHAAPVLIRQQSRNDSGSEANLLANTSRSVICKAPWANGDERAYVWFLTAILASVSRGTRCSWR